MMNILQCFNRFYLDNYLVIDNNIQPKSYIKLDFIVNKRNSNLVFNLKVNFFKLMGERDFINRFQQSWAKNSMNSECSPANQIRKIIFIHIRNLRKTMSIGINMH